MSMSPESSNISNRYQQSIFDNENRIDVVFHGGRDRLSPIKVSYFHRKRKIRRKSLLLILSISNPQHGNICSGLNSEIDSGKFLNLGPAWHFKMIDFIQINSDQFQVKALPETSLNTQPIQASPFNVYIICHSRI